MAKQNKADIEAFIEELFHYGRDHFVTAHFLFKRPLLLIKMNPRSTKKSIITTLDSAAYLSNIGLEMLLKGCWVWEKQDKELDRVHGLYKIAKKIQCLANFLTENEWQLIQEVDLFGKTRYPRQDNGVGVGIGEEHGEVLEEVFSLITEAMPDELYKIYKRIGKSRNHIRKGGRVLLKKKIESSS